MEILDRIFCSTWTTCLRWKPDEALQSRYPPRHEDYRDYAPQDILELYEIYKPHVKEGRWTLGLFDMWCPRARPVKHSVHVSCWYVTTLVVHMATGVFYFFFFLRFPAIQHNAYHPA